MQTLILFILALCMYQDGQPFGDLIYCTALANSNISRECNQSSSKKQPIMVIFLECNILPRSRVICEPI